ncbi:D-alanine--D-alanine ligase family protein [Pararhizobium sp. PWRC1-1]|uniref:D-alanine--D-alanine ligase family protein n=1 Tax=Pararhizobium sp. PWRC1-1 TaxID=2804566 RepID=UPI003CF969CD
MRIGITFDLREDYAREGYDEEETAEFDHLDTILAIESALHSLGHITDRIGHARALAKRLVDGDRWDLVFNIAEGMHGFGRQALVPALLDTYRVPYTFSDPLALAVTLHKATAKRVVRDQGLCTADFAVVETLSDVEYVTLPFPLFIKPVAEGTSKGISAASKIRDLSELRRECERLLARHCQPVLVERYLPGREFTVGILGTGSASTVLGVMELELRAEAEPEIYSYENKKHFEERVKARLAMDAVGLAAAELALSAWRGLGCRDAGRIDVRCDAEGKVNFLEANPLAGLHPKDSDLPLLARLKGLPYRTLIEGIIASALSRVAKSAT